jgi:uridylate kinase
MESVVVSLGGSVLLSDNVDSSFITNLGVLLGRLKKYFRLYIVVGGGTVSRLYIKHGRYLGFSEGQLDLLGIAVTRVNARFLLMLLSNVNKVIPETTDDAVKCDGNIVVMGGTTPGHSTDLVGAELATKVDACRYIIATNVDGVFDKDPNKFSNSIQYSVIHIDKLLKSQGDSWDVAGKNTVIDGPALRLIKDASLKTLVVNGLHLEELERAILGKSFNGTRIEV